MAIPGIRFPFAPLALHAVPHSQGVFWLWDGDEVIYVGRATGSATIRSCLAGHHAGDYGRCTQSATHFGYEVSAYPAARCAELLEEVVARVGRRPRCLPG